MRHGQCAIALRQLKTKDVANEAASFFCCCEVVAKLLRGCCEVLPVS